jgi:predicted phosphodiesterase
MLFGWLKAATIKTSFNYTMHLFSINLKNIAIYCCLTFFAACDNIFDYSPYEIRVNTNDITNKNLNYLSTLKQSNDSITIALIADSHYMYSKLKDVVNSLNTNQNLDFVLVIGDIADHGLQKEFELFLDEIERLKVPYFTVIGNHDYRSNGEDVYAEMFGAFNYSFTYDFVDVIAFDDVIWESNKTPDFEWLTNEAAKLNNSVKIIATHIPPNSDQFTAYEQTIYYNILKKSQIDLSVHGHVHNYSISNTNGTNFINTGAVMKGKYTLLTIYKDKSFNCKEISL